DRALDYCVDENDIRAYLQTGKVPQQTEQLALDKYDDVGEFYAALAGHLSQSGPSAGKLKVPVLSRTSLNEMVSKVPQLPHLNQFEQDVLAAAGGGNAGRRLFPYGVQSAGGRGRTVEDNPDITIHEWIKGVHEGKNLTWSENVFSVEDVG